jgi:hypothetical protein
VRALSGYDARSTRLLAIFAAVGLAAAVIWREHVSVRWEDLDPLLGACWVGMGALAIYRVELRRDAMLAVVAFAGGALIETWGTRASLWHYFTDEQPPLFILPAWPAAALATERVVWALGRAAPAPSPARDRWVYVAAVGAFCVALAAWCRPGLGHPLTWVAFACVAITAVGGSDRRADLMRFAAGALVGFPLEYWGTSRACWTYWSGEVPPVVAVFAHGFATLAFARGTALLALALGRLGAPSPGAQTPP